jgi:hypothetical protein
MIDAMAAKKYPPMQSLNDSFHKVQGAGFTLSACLVLLIDLQ